MEGYIQKGNIYSHESGLFRLRVRNGRCLEVEFTERPALWVSAGTRSFDEAERFALRKLSKGGRLVSSRSQKLQDYGDPFFGNIDDSMIRRKNEKFGRRYTDGYYKQLISHYRNYIRPFFGSMNPAAITDVLIENWYLSLKGVKSHLQLCSSTKLIILDAMSLLMKELTRQGVVDSNPMETVERLKAERTPREAFTHDEVQAFFPEDRRALLSIWRSLRWALYFSIMSDTGWRPAEVMGISRQSLYLNGVFQLESVEAESRRVKKSIKTTNSGQKYKVGILSEYTKSLLDEYLESLKGEYLFMDIDGTFPVAMANRVLREAMKKAGVPEMSPATGRKRTQYGFRHFFSTYMHENRGKDGLSEEDISEMMAHTGYRPEYDHRTAQMMIFRLQARAKDTIDAIHQVKAE